MHLNLMEKSFCVVLKTAEFAKNIQPNVNCHLCGDPFKKKEICNARCHLFLKTCFKI